jgi:thymidylate synthase ThyX
MIKVEIVADSVNQQNDRLISMILTYPRIIHAEMLTHRVFSRNASSSRAVPVKKMIDAVRDNTFCPFEFQKAHKGMQGTEYFTGQDKEECKQLWLESAEFALQQAEKMDKKGISKQVINRILEPYQYYTVLITGSREGWDNFFNLRCPSYSIKELIDGDSRVFKSKKDFLKELDYEPIFPSTDLDWLKINTGQAEIHMMQLAECIWGAVNENKPNNNEN